MVDSICCHGLSPMQLLMLFIVVVVTLLLFCSCCCMDVAVDAWLLLLQQDCCVCCRASVATHMRERIIRTNKCNSRVKALHSAQVRYASSTSAKTACMRRATAWRASCCVRRSFANLNPCPMCLLHERHRLKKLRSCVCV